MYEMNLSRMISLNYLMRDIPFHGKRIHASRWASACKFTSNEVGKPLSFFFFTCGAPPYCLLNLGLRLGFSRPQVSSHIKRVNHSIRVRLSSSVDNRGNTIEWLSCGPNRRRLWRIWQKSSHPSEELNSNVEFTEFSDMGMSFKMIVASIFTFSKWCPTVMGKLRNAKK